MSALRFAVASGFALLFGERFEERQTTAQRIEDAQAERFDRPSRPERIERPGR